MYRPCLVSMLTSSWAIISRIIDCQKYADQMFRKRPDAQVVTERIIGLDSGLNHRIGFRAESSDWIQGWIIGLDSGLNHRIGFRAESIFIEHCFVVGDQRTCCLLIVMMENILPELHLPPPFSARAPAEACLPHWPGEPKAIAVVRP